MTANDSKSTPKKAEDATRHPLALLADRPQRAESSYSAAKFGECQGCGGRSGSLDAEGICGVCHDAAYLAEWQAYAEQLESALRAQAEADSLQTRAVNWVREAFGTEPADCKAERSHRFLEEALEAGQAAGVTEQEAAQLVQYVYGREKGEIAQEVGGVMLTLAPFAAAFEVDMMAAAEAELARVNTPEIIEKCRRKNASKPRNSPLPGSDALALGGTP